MPKTDEFCPMWQILFATIILTSASIFTASHVPVSDKPFFLVCKAPKSNACTASPIQDVKTSTADRYRLVRSLRSHCGISDLKPATPSQKYVQVQPLEGKKFLLCKVNRIFYPSKLGAQGKEIRRGRREASPRGRYRGQTQSQYLSLNGEGKDDGKAEALSNADTSRASVSGKSGMGQAQSQSMYDPSCDECFGGSEPGADSLKRIPYGSGVPGTEDSGQKHVSGKPNAGTIHTDPGPTGAGQDHTGGTYGPGQGVNRGPTYTPGHGARYEPGQGSIGGPTFRPVQGGNGEPTYSPGLGSSPPTNKPGPENTGGTFRPGQGVNGGSTYTPGQGGQGATFGPGHVSAGGPTLGQGGNGEQTYTPSQGSGVPTTGPGQGINGGAFRPGQGGNGGQTYTPGQGSRGPSYRPGQGITSGPTFGQGQGGNNGYNYTPGQGSGRPVYGPGQGSNSGPTYVPDHGSNGAPTYGPGQGSIGGPAYGPGQESPGGLMQGPGPGNIGGQPHGVGQGTTGGPAYGPTGQGSAGGPIYTPGHGGSTQVYQPDQGSNNGQTYGPAQGNIGGPMNKPDQGSIGSPTYGPGQGSTGGRNYGPGQGGTSGPTYGPGHSNVGGPTFSPGQGNVDGTTYGPGTAPTYKLGQGPYSGQTGTNGWPIISGTFPGPGGLNYYCCVVSPNNNPQYLTVQGSGENLPKNIEQTLIDKLSGGVVPRPYQYPQIPNGYATGDGRYYQPKQDDLNKGIVGNENTGRQGTGVGIYPENGSPFGQNNNGIITQNGNLPFRPVGTGTGQGQNPIPTQYIPHDGGGIIQKYPHETTNGHTVNGGYAPDSSNTRHPSDLGYAGRPNLSNVYGSNKIPEANQGQPGQNSNHLPSNTLEGQYSPFGVGQGINEQGRPFVGPNGIPQWPSTGPGGQFINQYGFQPENKFNRNQETGGVNSLATPHEKTTGKGNGNFGQGQFSPHGQPTNQYGPGGQPSNQYGSGGQSTNQYGPGGQPASQYSPGGQPANQYGPDGQSASQYSPGGQPANQYGPGGQPASQYSLGGQPANQYGPGGQPASQYSPGGQPANQYGPGGQPASQYSPGGQPANQYGPGGQPANQYSPGGQPSNQNGPGGQPANKYGPGGQPANQYSPGGQPSNHYGSGGQTTDQYGPVSQPTNQYGPGGQITTQYGSNGQPTNQYGSGSEPTNQYGPSGQTATQYGPNGQPINQYGPGGQPTNQYSPAVRPIEQNGPSGQTTNQYSPGGQITNQYGPSGKPKDQYGPGDQTTNQYHDNQQSGTGTNGYNQGTTGQRSDVSGVPHNVVDPNSIAGSLDDDSEALATISQDINGTVASASSKGGNDKGRAQTQVQGTYTGSGSFSAQAQISDENKGAESEVSGGKKGASSSAQGRGRNHKSQAGVQLGSETGSLQTQAQSETASHSSNSQVQGSVKGGMADAQARGPGSTSSQAQIGFTPYKAGDKSHETIKGPFVGSGTASAQSSGRIGQSQSQLQGTFKYGISYTGAAQAGSSLDKDAVFPNRLPFNKINVFDEKNKNIDVNNEDLTTTELPPLPLVPVEETTTEKDETLSNSKRYSSHTHLDHHKNETPTTTPSSALSPVDNRRSFQPAFSNNGADYEYDKEDNAPDDYDPDNVDGEQGEYNYDDFPKDPDNTHQSLLSSKKALDIKQTNKGNSQHILLDSLNSHDAKIIQKTSDERKIYQPGEKVPGTNGYTIPIGFTGSIQAVSSKDRTYAVGSPDSPSQAQSVTLTPGTGKVRYVYPQSISDYSKNVNRHDLRSLNHKIDDSNKYLSVSKSVTGALDGDNNIKKQYSHTYYTKSSSCGYFTFTCTMVSGSNGRKKVCRPKVPTNPDGTPMRC